MSEVGKIHTQIIAVMQDVDSIGKDRRNQQGSGFQYRGIDDIYNALHSLLAKHGVYTVPTVQDMRREERQSKSGGTLNYSILTIDFRFYAVDGSYVTATMIGEAMDSGDKASNKAMSVAHKYAFLQVFAIPTEDDKDPDADTHDVAPRASGRVQGALYDPGAPDDFGPDPYTGLGYEPAEVKAKAAFNPGAPPYIKTPSPAQVKRLFAIAATAGWPNKELKDYVKSATGAESSNDIPLAKYDELCKYIETHPYKGR